MTTVYDSIIIGSGLSGLQAAKDLQQQHGYRRVLVLEAMDYVGGRVCQNTTFIPGVKIELGAEIVHGKNTSLTKFAMEQGEVLEPIFCWAQGDGGPMEFPVLGGYGLYYLGPAVSSSSSSSDNAESNAKGKKQQKKSQKKRDKTKDIRILRYDEEDEDFLALNDTFWQLYTLDEEHFSAEVTLQTYLEGKGFSKQILNLANAGYANTLCSTLQDLSMKHLIKWSKIWEAHPEEDEGEFRFQRSYKCLIDFLKDGLDIQLQKVVTGITQIALPTSNGMKGVLITCRDGSEYYAKTALVTASPSVLQQGVIRFEPPLPSDKLHAIQTMNMFPAVKVYVKFSKVLFPKGLQGIIVADEKFMFPEIWFEDCSPFLDASHNAADGVCYATGYATAQYAERILALPEEQVYESLLSQMDQIIQRLQPWHCQAEWEDSDDEDSDEGTVKENFKYYKHIPRPTLPSTYFIGGFIQRWDVHNRPFVGGGYCSPSVHSPIDAGDILARNIDDVVYFAGEATMIPAATAYAALDSGTRAGKEIHHYLSSSI